MYEIKKKMLERNPLVKLNCEITRRKRIENIQFLFIFYLSESHFILNGCATKEKKIFFLYVRKKVPMATKPRLGGGGLMALVAGPLRKELFFAAS